MRAAALPLLLALGLAPTRAGAAASAEEIYALIEAQDLKEAARALAPLERDRPHDPDVAFSAGDLLLHRGDYAAAASRFAEAERAHGKLGEEAHRMAELARGSAEVTKGFASQKSAHFVISYAPGKDALLAAYALETLERARAALLADFGWADDEPVRVEIYGSTSDLARVSPLTEKEIETSGTIALCKYNRLMIVSPRALLAGYPWRDTLNHEYTHFVVTRFSKNTVPVWLHEGLAKFEERRWRLPPDGKAGMTPVLEHLLASALADKRLIPFSAMHPSIAMLPSQAEAALAFAQVYSLVAFVYEEEGWKGVRALIERARGAGRFDALEARWRAWLPRQKLRPHPGLIPEEAELRFKKGTGPTTEASGDESGRIGEERARKLARLGGLLRGRHRLKAAALEYEKAQAIVGAGHPTVANKLARTYLELGEVQKAIAAAEPALALYPDQAAPNATLGEAWMRSGSDEKAARFFEAALAISPFDPMVHCGLEKIYERLGRPEVVQARDACRLLQ